MVKRLVEKNKILVKRRKKANLTQQQKFLSNLEEWAAYWRSNPHRFITDYLGLTLFDFQKVLIYQMFMYPNFIFLASRGLAKSTLALLFAVAYCILYPGTTIVVVAPTKSQSTRFVKKVMDFQRKSKNLENEISEIKTGQNESKIAFKNDSEIVTLPYSENALGVRAHILIVDEFVRTEKDVIIRVFVPMLTNSRTPPYMDLTREEKDMLPEEPNRQLYLSSVRGADEWSFEYFKTYLEEILNGSRKYATVAVPYNFGVKNRYISKTIVEQSFKENQENTDALLAEYLCQPEHGSKNSFYNSITLANRREQARAMVCMSDEEWVEYKDDKTKWPFYQEKLSEEIRILSMDVAVIEAAKNDNTAFWVLRLIPNGSSYKRIFQYAESMHGINSIKQAERAKQLFYEFDCDYFAIDVQGAGVGVYDILTKETEDRARGIIYPAWTVANPDDIKMSKRAYSLDGVPVVYAVRTSAQEKSVMLQHSRSILSENHVSFLLDWQDGIDYFLAHHNFAKIDDQNLRNRILNPYAQTEAFINEAINLDQVATQGYISVKEKSGRRKDRVMSYVYALDIARLLEQNLKAQSEFSILDWVFTS